MNFLIVPLIAVATAAVLGLAFLLAKLPRKVLVAITLASAALVAVSIVLPMGISDGSRWLEVARLIVGVVGLMISPIALVLSRPPRHAESGPVAEWSEAHGVSLTESNADFVQSYVVEGHRLRVVCSLGGLVLPGAITAATGIDLGLPGLTWILLGYLVGTVWGEARLARRPTGAGRQASLATRSLSDYLAGRLRIAQLLVPCAGVVLAAVASRLSLPEPRAIGPEFSWAASSSSAKDAAVALGLAVPGVMLVVWLLQRHIVAKPQPSLEPDLLRADDAVRASSVHLLSGTGLAVGLMLIALQLVSIGQLLVGDVGTPVGAAGLLLLVAALFAWRYYGHRAWVVRRTDLEAAP